MLGVERLHRTIEFTREQTELADLSASVSAQSGHTMSEASHVALSTPKSAASGNDAASGKNQSQSFANGVAAGSSSALTPREGPVSPPPLPSQQQQQQPMSILEVCCFVFVRHLPEPLLIFGRSHQ